MYRLLYRRKYYVFPLVQLRVKPWSRDPSVKTSEVKVFSVSISSASSEAVECARGARDHAPRGTGFH